MSLKGNIIVLTHEPDIFTGLHNSNERIQLILAGHTHGGQIRLPFIGGIIVPSSYGNKYSKGYIKENGKQMFVTSGIGTSILPVRFLCPPEIILITLKNRPIH